MVGGALALTLLLAREADQRGFAPGGPAWLGRLLEPKEALPYGVAIAIGALVAFPSSPVFQALGAH